jgi:hypothetical protein
MIFLLLFFALLIAWIVEIFVRHVEPLCGRERSGSPQAKSQAGFARDLGKIPIPPQRWLRGMRLQPLRPSLFFAALVRPPVSFVGI